MAAHIVVKTAAELYAALTPANAGRTIEVEAGVYAVDHTLQMPPGAVLRGSGRMEFGPEGLPAGLAAKDRATLRASAGWTGDMVTLGDGARLERLVIEDVPGRPRNGGNLVVVGSARPGDKVSGTIEECELVNPNPSLAGPDGPRGRAILVLTRNPLSEASPHAGGHVAAAVRRSIVRATGGGSGLFAVNFAPNGCVEVRLERNVVSGGIDASGGVSRPNPVTGSQTRIVSEHNLFKWEAAVGAGFGWSLHGGSNPPVPFLSAPYTNDNLLTFESKHDRVEGFAVALFAFGGSRPLPSSGPVDGNRVELSIDGAKLSGVDADLVLAGATSGNASLTPGDDNRLVLTMTGVTGSGARANFYADAAVADGTPLGPGHSGSGNRLEIVGELSTFKKKNSAIDPPPPSSFFV